MISSGSNQHDGESVHQHRSWWLDCVAAACCAFADAYFFNFFNFFMSIRISMHQP
jgi:hypothetical protein